MNSTTTLIRALVAYSVHEHEVGTATRVAVTLRGRSCTVEDDGRGIGLHRDGYVAGLVEQLAARGGAVALHGLGLAIIAMAADEMIVESRRDGHRFTQAFVRGLAEGPVRSEPAQGATGTRVALTLGNEGPEIDCDEVLAQVDLWRQAHPGLRIDVMRGA